MKKILIASHGRMASGMKNSLELFVGRDANIVAVDAYVDGDMSDAYLDQIRLFIDECHEEGGVVFTDLFGGSVNQKVFQMIYGQNRNVQLVTGVNLPILLSVYLDSEVLTSDHLNDLILESNVLQVDLQKKNEIANNDEESFLD